jgi:1-acyl-sn-glycerol-3-phosphate acyltransferase
MPLRRSKTPSANANTFFRFLRLVGRGLFGTLFRIEPQGLERISSSGGCVLACNHLSWIDPLIILCVLPPEPRIHYLAAAEYTVDGPGLVPWIVRQAGGIIPIDRQGHKGDRTAVVQALQVLREGAVLGIFPEGRCGETEGQVQPLKEGAAIFAAKTGRPIQVIGLSGTAELYLRKHFVLRVGPLIEPREGESQAELLDRLAVALAQTVPPLHPDQPRVKRMAWLSKLF